MMREKEQNNSSPADDLLSLEGVVKDIIFRNEDNGYTVLTLDGLHKETVVGTMPFLSSGEKVKFSGQWQIHATYGRQFQAERFEHLKPDSSETIEHYLAAGLISGIGPVLARRLVERFGLETLDVLTYDPKRAAQVKGISPAKAAAIAEQMQTKKDFEELILFLHPLGVSTGRALRIFHYYGTDAVKKIKENPYRLAEEIFGIGFGTADQLAIRLGVDLRAPERIKNACKHILKRAAAQGHTYLTAAALLKQTRALLYVEVTKDQIIELVGQDPALCLAQTAGAEKRIALTALLQAEEMSAGHLKRLLQSRPRFCSQLSQLEIDGTLVHGVLTPKKIELTREQQEALTVTLKEPVSILTGGPGTGKTTILRLLCDSLAAQGCRILLAAPTGRAARKLGELTGRPAQTLHRLLELQYLPQEDSALLPYERRSQEPLPADLVIVDEASMIDVFLFNSLLQTIKEGCRLLLVGDIDQLPSVGPGDVLRDLIDSGLVPTARLTRIFRQAQESLIVVNAHRIHLGKWPLLSQAKDSSFLYIKKEDATGIADAVLRLLQTILPEEYGLDPLQDVFVLTPTRKGPAGSLFLNQTLQKALQPPKEDRDGLMAHGSFFGLNDRVMQIRNNYDLVARQGNSGEKGVFNGEIGTVIAVDNETGSLQVCFDDDRIVIYDRANLEDLELAYAMTVHKSQGSEYPVVVLAVPAGSPMLLTRNLLYTAVTRAQDKLLLIAREQTIDQILNNRLVGKRQTFLCELLRQTADDSAV